MKPTMLLLVDNGRAYVELPPRQIRHEIKMARRREQPAVKLRGAYLKIDRILEIDGQPVSATSGEGPSAHRSRLHVVSQRA